jgi:hypothetical protein
MRWSGISSVIGEACNNLRKHDPRFVSAHPEIAWAAADKMRNALTHGHFDLHHEIVWRTIQHDLPAFAAAIALARATSGGDTEGRERSAKIQRWGCASLHRQPTDGRFPGNRRRTMKKAALRPLLGSPGFPPSRE